VILPPDISERVEKQAQDEGRPQSRIIINDLARIPYLDQQAKLGELVRDMEVIPRWPISGSLCCAPSMTCCTQKPTASYGRGSTGYASFAPQC
jgi:hypothetical protein